MIITAYLSDPQLFLRGFDRVICNGAKADIFVSRLLETLGQLMYFKLSPLEVARRRSVQRDTPSVA